MISKLDKKYNLHIVVQWVFLEKGIWLEIQPQCSLKATKQEHSPVTNRPVEGWDELLIRRHAWQSCLITRLIWGAERVVTNVSGRGLQALFP